MGWSDVQKSRQCMNFNTGCFTNVTFSKVVNNCGLFKQALKNTPNESHRICGSKCICGINVCEKIFFASIFKRLWREDDAFEGQRFCMTFFFHHPLYRILKPKSQKKFFAVQKSSRVLKLLRVLSDRVLFRVLSDSVLFGGLSG